MVYKVSKALATLKEYPLEEEVLDALLAQRVWRRGKRAAWYERRALIQTNYLCKGKPEELPNGKTRAPIDERVLQRAVNGLHDALKDDDVGLGTGFLCYPQHQPGLTIVDGQFGDQVSSGGSRSSRRG